VKLAPLLTRFLLSNKRLELPGIGSFQLDPGFLADPDNNKSDKKIDPAYIRFTSNATLKESPDLVQYIATETGKFKALAAADLDSYVQLIKQFLNIGKPFLLEGIGSLVKVKSGEFAFTSGLDLPESLKDYSTREISSTSSVEESFSDFRKPINKNGAKTGWRKPVAALLIIAGIGLAVWGGYTVYKVSGKQENTPGHAKKNYRQVDSKTNKNDVAADNTPLRDSSFEKQSFTNPAQTVSGSNESSIKYVLEKAGPKRAFERFAKLKSFQWPVQMETKDSLIYTLFMILPTGYSDTTRILDSLTLLNGRSVTMAK